MAADCKGTTYRENEKAAIPEVPVPEEEKESAGEFKGQVYRAGQEVASEPEAWWRECRHVVRTSRSLLTWEDMHGAAALYGSRRASAVPSSAAKNLWGIAVETNADAKELRSAKGGQNSCFSLLRMLRHI